MKNESCFIYILKSQKTGKYYIGHTKNLEDRINEHNRGRSKYTRDRGPWDLIHTEQFDTRSLAMKREIFLKNLKSWDCINKIILGYKFGGRQLV